MKSSSSSSSKSATVENSRENEVLKNIAPNKNAILVSPKQQGNPLLQQIRNIAWEFNPNVIPDYVMGSSCAFFLSIKFHHVNPAHIDMRIRELGKNFRLRTLLVFIDDDNNSKVLADLNKLCFAREVTMLLCWSYDECARYLEALKLYENKPATSIQEKVETEFIPQISKVLTTGHTINKTDVMTLLDVFHNFTGVCSATKQQMIQCPGMGDKKVKRIYQALHEPFKSKKQKTETI